MPLSKSGGHQRLPTLLGFVAISVAAFFGIRSCQHSPAPHPATNLVKTTVPNVGTIVMENGKPVLPNTDLTPGDLVKDFRGKPLTVEQICKRGYSRRANHITAANQTFVFSEYHLDRHSDYFKVDHLISPELGGSNDRKNLWPLSYMTPTWNAHAKERLEGKLHRMVCVDHTISLQDAQAALSRDWIAAYKKYMMSDQLTITYK
jgi:hypothetical protein